jgi:hypothetical protein
MNLLIKFNMEKGLPKKYSWSIDVSTTNLGSALWDENGSLVEVRHLVLKTNKDIPEEVRYLDKAKMFKQYAKKFKAEIESTYNCEIDNIFVEEPLMNTPVNIVTTAKLLGFNAIVCYILDELFGKSPYLISIYISRKLFFPEHVTSKKVKGEIKETLSLPKDIDKKHYIWEKVARLYPEITWHYKTDGKKIKETSYDISDSIVVGLAGLKVLGLK